MPQITTRIGKDSDYPAIAAIQQAAPEAAQWPVGDYSNYTVIVALSNGRIVGFCAFRAMVPGEAELLNLAVDPDYRRQGVGSTLLEALCSHAPGHLFLEVAENNEPAITLYRRHGWERIATRNGYYSSGKINAVVMKKSSC